MEEAQGGDVGNDYHDHTDIYSFLTILLLCFRDYYRSIPLRVSDILSGSLECEC